METAIVASGFRQFEQAPLGVFDLVLRRHVERCVIGDIDHVLADGDQRAAQGEIVDRPSVVFGVDDRHGFARQTRQILGYGHLADLVVSRKKGLDGYRIGGLAHPYNATGHFEDLAVQGFVQMAGFQEVGDPVVGLVVDENGAKQRLLRLDIAGRFPVKASSLIGVRIAQPLCRIAHRSSMCVFVRIRRGRYNAKNTVDVSLRPPLGAITCAMLNLHKPCVEKKIVADSI